jgi:hypothetical protein
MALWRWDQQRPHFPSGCHNTPGIVGISNKTIIKQQAFTGW